MRSDLPSGTVTFLFTDVEASTRLLQELGAEGYAAALAEHRRLIREACAHEGGVEVDTQGDAFFFAFPTAPGALVAAAAFTEALASGPISVRVGVHTGTPLQTEEGYVGGDVHRAARIAASGHGGQVLVSGSTAALIEPSNSLLPGSSLLDLGEHRLKDLSAPERIYQLGDGEFPALSSLHRTNLPIPATPFLGRERDLAEVVELLSRDEARLLTLTGPGGTGKTRLALQAAAEVSDRFPDGVWWIPLAPLRDASLVLSTIAQVLEVKEEPGEPLAETLRSATLGQQALLLLDNVEHLLPDAAVDLAGLASVQGPALLVTSRERLQLQGEQVYPVPTLDEADGVSLFLARARSLYPGFTGNGAVSELCTRLDNLPLALELAAARTALFSPEQLLERLSQRLDLLKGARDVDPRQQTLRATIEWSYDLLDLEEQRLFRSLSVFAGGCTFEAAEQVCRAEPDPLQSLLDKSLLRRLESEAGPRYWMLETIREFGWETLPDEERGLLRDAHLALFSEKVYSLRRATRGRERHATAFLRVEHANVLAALAWAFEHSAAEPAQKILEGAWFFWMTYGHAAQGDRLATQVIALPSENTVLYGSALGVAAEFPRFRGDPERAVDVKRRALAIFDELGLDDPDVAREMAANLADQSDLLSQLGRFDEADECVERALAIRRTMGDPRGISHALDGAASVAWRRGALAQAARLFSESAELQDDRFEAAVPLLGLGFVRRAMGDLPGAAAAFEEARQRAVDSGDRWLLANVHAGLGVVAGDEGRAAAAVELLARALTEMEDLGLVFDIADEIGGVLDSCREELGEDGYARAFSAGAATVMG